MCIYIYIYVYERVPTQRHYRSKGNGTYLYKVGTSAYYELFGLGTSAFPMVYPALTEFGDEFTYIYIHICVCICIHIYIYIYTHVCIIIYIQTCT